MTSLDVVDRKNDSVAEHFIVASDVIVVCHVRKIRLKEKKINDSWINIGVLLTHA